ncbi:hypothetical protein PR202_gb11620 [Eleusine coracana subsp. coracana]|uniref:Transposase-associated domain-containing protein n=1 Tax=Eleusine coracana subsp. coracana TaxID=191504 RepID=A0AAV5EP93_ELECO|nr:hypothetical protein PR202_gb11620 [Eleusine coracana subsp. coracana]
MSGVRGDQFNLTTVCNRKLTGGARYYLAGFEHELGPLNTSTDSTVFKPSYKEWMRASRISHEYDKGLSKFIELALDTSAEQNRILCPCKTCGNNYWLEADDVRDHLISQGFMKGYTSWIHHGEGMRSAILGDASNSDDEKGTAAGMNSVRGRESGDNYAKKRRLMKLSALEELNHTTKKQKQLDSQLEDEISSDDDHEESDNGETETENEYDSEESESEYEEGQANFEDEEDQADLEGEQYQAELEKMNTALAEVVEVRQENKKLWSVVDTLMTNQAKLQQQYDELKSQISAPQRFPSVDSSPIVGPVPQDPLRDVANQEASVTHERPEPEEQMGVVSPNLNRIKSRISEHQTTKDKTPPQQSVEKAKKQRRFRTPLHMANEGRIDIAFDLRLSLLNVIFCTLIVGANLHECLLQGSRPCPEPPTPGSAATDPNQWRQPQFPQAFTKNGIS